MKLYHTSSLELRNPDINYGRKNADFGGGFYLSDSLEFAQKWANDAKATVNEYTLDLTGLTVKRFSLNSEWFSYISQNRAGGGDAHDDADVIIGPIANDTLYDTYGIIFSGLISGDDALRLLQVGNRYTQINIKSEKAAAQLKWVSAKHLTAPEIEAAESAVRAEEKEFRAAFWDALSTLDNFKEIESILS